MAQSTSLKWPAVNAELKAIFDTITNKFGPPDVYFQAESQIFKVHKKVLEKHSSVLKVQLSDAWRTSGDVLHVDEVYVEPEVVEELLTWMYYTNAGRDCECSTENAYSLCIAADYLMIPTLVNSCCKELCRQIDLDNSYEIYALSKQLNLDTFRPDSDWSVKPSVFIRSPQFNKWNAEELELFIQKTLQVEDSLSIRNTILLSLANWIKADFVNRFGKLENFLEFLPPDTVSSHVLFWFMETELYSRLDEPRRKEYYVRPYLPTGVSSTDKLYCVRQTYSYVFMADLLYLDLSADVRKWSTFPTERFIFPPNDTQPTADRFGLISRKSLDWKTTAPILGVVWRKNIYFIGHATIGASKLRHIKVFSTETGEWISSEVTKPLGDYQREILAGVVLDDYIYITESENSLLLGSSVTRYCLNNKQWQVLKEMQTARMAHQLVTLDGLLYAIGGEVLELGHDREPERYNSQTERWEYIARLNYLHQHPAAVAHEGQIYVLSWAGFEVYSPETDRWNKLPVPDVCHRPSLVSIAGSLWLLTDSFYFPMTSRLVYEFDVVDQKWTRLPDLPKGYYTDFSMIIKQ